MPDKASRLRQLVGGEPAHLLFSFTKGCTSDRFTVADGTARNAPETRVVDLLAALEQKRMVAGKKQDAGSLLAPEAWWIAMHRRYLDNA